jgi:hypothetical protein
VTLVPVLYNTLLRLLRDMSLKPKKSRKLETMQELGILEIKDLRIGDTAKGASLEGRGP